ncbi:MAG: hypothetical protein V9E82_05985 [Candidatus Nanopelagicales bacterium]
MAHAGAVVNTARALRDELPATAAGLTGVGGSARTTSPGTSWRPPHARR